MNFAKIARRISAAALVFVLVGVLMVAYWRGTGALPGAGTLSLYLLVLPLALVGCYWLVRWQLGRRAARTAGAATPAGAGDGAGVGAHDGDAIAPDRMLLLLASAVLLPAGASASDVVMALLDPQRPPLHPTFKDDAGLPVFAAPVEGIDADAAAQALREHPALDPDHFEQDFGEAQVRALTLLEPVADELLYAALPVALAEVDAYAPPPAAAPASVLRVQLLLPATWPAPARQAAADWLLAKATAAGYGDGHVAVQALPVASAADVWRLLDQLGHLAAREPCGDRHLLLSAHSQLDEAAIEALAQQPRGLLGSGRPEGAVAGEGAAGVLLAGPSPSRAAQEANFDLTAPLRLHRMSRAQALVGVPSRRVSQHANELLSRALATAAQPADAIAAVLSDGDHRPSRAVELAGAMSLALPDLDPIQHGLHLGLVCGDLGAVAPLALLAIAAAQAELTAAPVIAISVADDALRVALAVSPMPVPVPLDGVADAAGAAKPSTSPNAPARALAQPA